MQSFLRQHGKNFEILPRDLPCPSIPYFVWIKARQNTPQNKDVLYPHRAPKSSLGVLQMGFKRWGPKQIQGYLTKKAFFLCFVDFPGALRALRKRVKKAEKAGKCRCSSSKKGDVRKSMLLCCVKALHYSNVVDFMWSVQGMKGILLVKQ